MTENYKIFGENIEETALNQFHIARKLECVEKAALMPDAHTGYALPIGAVMATRDMVFPAWIGFDLGCGLCALPTKLDKQDVIDRSEEIFADIYREVPVGFNHRKYALSWEWIGRPKTQVLEDLFIERGGLKQLGTLGGGNHFIEIGYDENDKVWIIVHSGSRGIGHKVATHYMKLASGDGKAREGHFGFATDSKNGCDYIIDALFCQEFALENRKRIIVSVISAINGGSGGFSMENIINRNHNHVEFDSKNNWWIHRKGATHAENGMMGVIPGNMRDGSFIVMGRGNKDSLCSSSHGAGRVGSRRWAKENLSMGKFTHDMNGIKAKVDMATLDESAGAYKNIFDVMAMQKDLVTVTNRIKPIINIKG